MYSSNWIRRYSDIFAFNGKEWVRKYFSNAFHVSELRFNLLTRDYDNIPTTKNAYEEWKHCCSGRKKSYS